MSPMAGRPPFATDEPDSYYESPPQPQRLVRQPAPVDPNHRTSNYDVYDNYFQGKAPPQYQAHDRRESGTDAVGMGFMNGASDDEDSDSEYSHKPIMNTGGHNGSKHAALAQATGAIPRSHSPPQSRSPPQTHALPQALQPSAPPQNILAPRPGYAAPISALNLARPEPTAAPAARQDPGLLANPFNSPSPSLPGTPHALAPPISPITPAFARPRPPKEDVTFEASKPIPRGNKEDTLLPKRGDAGDHFWRRFSMVAKDESSRKSSSSWLTKTQSGSSRLSTWVWVVGLVLLLCVGGGIGIGWYFSHQTPDHQQPSTLTGDQGSQAASPTAPVGSGKPTLGVTSLRVTPTHTVARRAAAPFITGVPAMHRRHKQRRA